VPAQSSTAVPPATPAQSFGSVALSQLTIISESSIGKHFNAFNYFSFSNLYIYKLMNCKNYI
jgi:hypothetical protein